MISDREKLLKPMEVKGLWDRELQRWVYPPFRENPWGGQISTERWAMRRLPWEDLGGKYYKLSGGNDSGMRKEMAHWRVSVRIKAGKPENRGHSLRKKMHNSADLNLHRQRITSPNDSLVSPLLPQCSMWKNMKISNSRGVHVWERM